MPNQLYNDVNNNNIEAQFGTFIKNPMQFLMRKNINVPEQFSNNPQGAVQYLLNNGTMSQDTFNRIWNIANRMGVKI